MNSTCTSASKAASGDMFVGASKYPFSMDWFKGQIQLLETPVLVGGLEHFLCFPYTVLGMSSSQLIKSYFSEGWVYHQPAIFTVNIDGFPGQIFPSNPVT
jgi:hypothetical protein